MAKSFVLTIPRTSFNSASLTGSYQLVNVGGFPDSISLLRFVNDSNVGITISYDGVTDHDYCLASSTMDTAIFGDASSDYTSGFSRGRGIYVKGSAGAGLFYVVGYYQPN